MFRLRESGRVWSLQVICDVCVLPDLLGGIVIRYLEMGL